MAKIFHSVLIILLTLLLWEMAVRIFDIPTWLLPSIVDIYYSSVKNFTVLMRNTTATLFAVVYGFGLAILIGGICAILINVSPFMKRLLMPFIVFFQTTPKSAIAPLFMVWFGFGLTPKILVVLLISFFPIVINFTSGLNSLSTECIYLAKSMGAGPVKTFIRFRIPNALPMLFQGFKISITLALVGAIVGEFVGADRGLGYLLLVANGLLDTPLIFSIILLLSIIGAALFYIVVFIERLVLPWHITIRG